MNVIIETEKGKFPIKINRESKSYTNKLNNTCSVFESSFIKKDGISFNLHMLINGNSNECYDIKDFTENWLQADLDGFLVRCPIPINEKGGIDITISSLKFSFIKTSERSSLMDNHDFKYTFEEILQKINGI